MLFKKIKLKEIMSSDMFYECLSYSDNDLLPKKGDFSLIKSEYIKKVLTHDYLYFNKEDMWWLFKNKFVINISLPQIKNRCHPEHSYESFIYSMTVLRFIAINGWTEFVMSLLNIKEIS